MVILLNQTLRIPPTSTPGNEIGLLYTYNKSPDQSAYPQSDLGLLCQYVLQYPVNFQGIDTISKEVTVSKLFCLSCEKESTLKGKNLLPLGANSFL